MENNLMAEMRTSADLTFSFANILKISSSVSDFRTWLNDYHKIDDDEKFLSGYKFFLDTCIRGFVDSIILDTSLGLDEDFTFFSCKYN